MEALGGLANFTENCEHNMGEAAKALKWVHENRERTKQRRNSAIQQPSPGVEVVKGNFLLAPQSGC